MSMIVSKHIEGHYEITLAVPEDLWVEILAGKMLCTDVTVLSMALGRGLIELMTMFGRPYKVEVRPAGKELTHERVPTMSQDDAGG